MATATAATAKKKSKKNPASGDSGEGPPKSREPREAREKEPRERGKAFTVWGVSEEILRHFKAECAIDGKTMKDAIEEAMKQYYGG